MYMSFRSSCPLADSSECVMNKECIRPRFQESEGICMSQEEAAPQIELVGRQASQKNIGTS
jgi:hypothetical protein